jgi:hypothetical protein
MKRFLLLANLLALVASPHSAIARMRTIDANGNRADPRPHAWCGWYMRQHFHVPDRKYNRALEWARYGSPSHGPAIGAIVVWPHHVGLITGRNSVGWIVKSGNDGHTVRERERSVHGAVAFRWPTGMAMQ